MTKADDFQYTDEILTRVEDDPEGWAITGDIGTLFIPKVEGIVPTIGQTVRYYGKGFGYVVRGVDIDGKEVYYRSEAEQAAEDRRQSAAWHQEKKTTFERTGRAILDAQYERLPAVFQQRLDRFRRNKADFRWEMESYEMSCCVTAVVIARACRFSVDDLLAFAALPWRDQKEQIPDLDEGHSGNSWGIALMLARVYTEEPKLVPLVHGGLCGLLGCADYGHVLPTEEEIATARSTIKYIDPAPRIT